MTPAIATRRFCPQLKRAFFQQLIGQADERGGLPDAALDLGLVQAHVARAVGDVAGAGLLKQLVLGVLHDKADEKAEAAQVCALLPQVPAVHKDAARRRAVQAVEMADKRGFSAARRADDTDKVALLDGEGDVIQRLRCVGHTLVIDVAQVFNTNDFGHSCSFPAGYSPVAVPFRHTWEFFVRGASPKGKAVGRSARRLMRGGERRFPINGIPRQAHPHPASGGASATFPLGGRLPLFQQLV